MHLSIVCEHREMGKGYRLGVIGGDGIGPEVAEAALVVLDAAERRFGFTTKRTTIAWSGAMYTRGERVTPEMIDGLRDYDAVLLGAIGHPDAPRGVAERDILIGARRRLDLYVNLRPIVVYSDALSPLKGKSAREIDFVIVRENTEDVYAVDGWTKFAGTPREEVMVEMRFTRPGIERIIRYAYALARTRPRKHLTLVDKANAIPVMGLMRTVLEEIGREFPDVTSDAMYVDATTMWFVLKPEQFDTIVTTNLFGDIISDLGAALAGGLGVGASGNIRPGAVSIFEPIHGSAPKYTGQGIASPVGTIGALQLLLDHIGEHEAANAVDTALRTAFRTAKIKGVDAGTHRTREVADIVAELVAKG